MFFIPKYHHLSSFLYVTEKAGKAVEKVLAMDASRKASQCAYDAVEFANECVLQTTRKLLGAKQSNDAKEVALNIAKDAAESAKSAAGVQFLSIFPLDHIIITTTHTKK